ncbi:4-hydroxyphenylpyruvate dioxygenase-like protein [Acropora cervicornis]|uniref:4-hydroxyphenylpyruvate dioxygenase-like protein n=1 Tax=Acropora cervicornis TaxID=6130 RepID=A0AAD9VF62_ACRCE|nr:4-hydroxyphenylpyruvate dioxygenase-like protein [Acropora cervicornis]
MVVRLHHVEILCQNLQQSLKQFCGKYGFRVAARSPFPNQVILNRDAINFVLSEGAHDRDTVFNVALEVKDVKQAVDIVQRNNGKVIRGPQISADSNGEVESAVIQTPIGNVVHTLLNSSNYGGIFLPGFHDNNMALRETDDYVTSAETETSYRRAVVSESILKHFDHITFACPLGTSQSIMKWYENCFGFSRFNISSHESPEGFYVQSSIQGASIGMKLTAMQYWFCSETELTIKTEEPGGGVKFVFAEPLPGQGPNQVQTFLREHGGPGIQHIGLYTSNISEAVATLKDKGVTFIDPPAAYYSEEGKLQEIKEVGESVELLKNHGILLDAESFREQEKTQSQEKTRYLMQVFTTPLFNRDTFFLEVIQRCGATGFGAGNITALWNAVDSYLKSHSDNSDSS